MTNSNVDGADGADHADDPACVPLDERATRAARERTRAELLVEIGVVVTLSALASFVSAASAFVGDDSFEGPRWYLGVMLAAMSIQIVVPLLYILRLRGAPLQQFGIVRFRAALDCTLALGVVVLALLPPLAFGAIAARWFPWIAEWTPAHRTMGAPSFGLGTVLCVTFGCAANGLREELSMRGYLIPRLEQVGLSTTMAILVSTAIFTSYHMYQGAYGLCAIFIAGLGFGLSFALTRRLWPCVIVHAVWDLWLLMFH